MRAPLIAGNWKMNGLVRDAQALAQGLRARLEKDFEPEIVVCPPFLALSAVREALAGSPVKLGAQDVHWEAKGAYTGEISTAMLQDVGCTHVILGHSERRHIMGETHEHVNRKTKAALAAGLTPIVCVGELLEERNMGDTNGVIERQVAKGLDGLSAADLSKIVIAYEPVWAIGTGKVAAPRQAEEVNRFIRKLVLQRSDSRTAEGIRILYGGAVKADNIKDLMAEEDIDGALVGGASLEVESFVKIVRYKS